MKDECLTLKLQVKEKDELISQLREELVSDKQRLLLIWNLLDLVRLLAGSNKQANRG